LSPRGGDQRKGTGGPERARNPPAPSSFGGNPILTPRCRQRPYASTNSGAATTAARVSLSGAPRTLPPPPLAFDHAPQRLAASRATEPLARAPLRGREVLVTPRTIAAKKSGIVTWTLALARWNLAPTCRIRPRCIGLLSLGRPPSLGAAVSVPPALRLAFLLSVGRPPILPAGLSPPPPPRRRAAFRTTVSGLGMGRSEDLLASFEQTPPPSRPARSLTRPRLVASWIRAQGSCELPAAKPRARSPLYSAPRRLL
jgi:hypothetical protein